MRAAILAFVADGVEALAESWSRAGLNVPYIAVDLRQLPQDDLAADHEWRGVLLDGTGTEQPVEGPLLAMLSDLRPDRVTIASIRGTEQGDGRPIAMLHLAKHVVIRAADDANRVVVEQFDLVYPQESDGSGPLRTTRQVDAFTVPELPGNYRRLIISPEDGAAPGEPDAGVRDESRDAVALHAALTVLGVLGGEWPDSPLQLGADREFPAVVRGHSRIVAGGRLCRDLAADYVAGPLMGASRSDCDPQRFRTVTGDESQSLLAAALDQYRAAWAADLAYNPPALPPWRAAPRLGAMEHLRIILNFIPFALAVVLRGGGSAAGGRGRATGSFMESDDLGYSLGELAEARPAEWWRWRAMDEERAATIRQSLAKSDTASSEKISPEAWEQLAQTATALCDGSELPFEVPDIRHDDRRLLLRADQVAEEISVPRVQPALSTSVVVTEPPTDGQPAEESEPGPQDLVRQAAGTELRRAEPIRPSTFVAALAWARGSPAGVPGGSEPEPFTNVVMTQRELAEEEAAESAAFAAARQSELHGTGESRAPAFLSALRSRSLGDLLVAATDAERWRQAAERGSRIDPERMERHLARYARRVWIMLIVAAALGLIWYIQGTEIMDWIQQRTDIDWSAGQVAVIATVVWCLILFLMTAAFYRQFAAEAERARRLVEARARAWSAAEHALAERNRLRVADRVIALWDEVLSHSLIGTGDATVLRSPLADPKGITRPVAMQVALPVMGQAERRRVDRDLTQEATTPGWRMEWLVALVGATEIGEEPGGTSGAQTKQLARHWFVDDGLGATPLRELHEAVAGPEPWSQVAHQWVRMLDDRLAVQYFADRHCPIEPPQVVLVSKETACGEWFKPLRVAAAPRYLLRAGASTHHQAGSGAHVLLAEFPSAGVRAPHGGDMLDTRPIGVRARGATAVSGRRELLQLDDGMLKLVTAPTTSTAPLVDDSHGAVERVD